MYVDPQGVVWSTEHGPQGGDELNRIVRGANYGWPVIEGAATRPDMVTPITFFTPSVAPSGASFYRGAAFPAFRDNLFVATLGAQALLRITLDATNPRVVVSVERLMAGRYGRLRDVVTGPDGYLYVSTSNRDGRNTPVASDDRILRIVPVK